jgi:hypothetical protein
VCRGILNGLRLGRVLEECFDCVRRLALKQVVRAARPRPYPFACNAMYSSILSFGLVAAASLSWTSFEAPTFAPTQPGADELPEGLKCGLGKEFHAGRRAALRAAVGTGWPFARTRAFGG